MYIKTTKQGNYVILTAFRLIFLLVLSLHAFQSVAAPVYLGKDISYQVFEDKEHQLSFEDFLQVIDEGLPSYNVPFSKGYARPTYWLHWYFPKDLFAEQSKLLLIEPNFLDAVNIYYRPVGNQAAPWVMREAGDRTPGIRGDLNYRFPVYKLPMLSDQDDGYEFIVRIKTTSTVIFDASLWDTSEFTEYSTKQTSNLSFYLGLSFLSTFLAVILAIMLRTRLLWSVVGFSSIYILIACIQGYATWLLPNITFALQHYLTNITSLTSYAFLIWVSTESLNIKKHLPLIYKIMLAIMLLIFSQLILIPLDEYGASFELIGILYLITAVIFFFSFFYVLSREENKVLTFLFAVSPLVCFMASFLSLSILFGWITYDRRIYLVWQYVPIINTVLVTVLAMLRRYEEKRLKQEYSQMTRELQIEKEAGFHQRQFMGIVSHEFRTPLSIISMALQNLYLMGGNNKNVVSRYKRIQRATERLVQLTDNCLADSRISAKALHLEKEELSWGALLDDASSLASFSEQHNVVISYAGKLTDFNSLTDYKLMGDKALLQIALANLIDNAVKHTSIGSIYIELKQTKEQYIITVTDQGKGIAEEMVKHIFERYQYRRNPEQEETAKVKSYGLGLYISKEIIEAHGGALDLIKNTPKGCTFQISLPKNKMK